MKKNSNHRKNFVRKTQIFLGHLTDGKFEGFDKKNPLHFRKLKMKTLDHGKI